MEIVLLTILKIQYTHYKNCQGKGLLLHLQMTLDGKFEKFQMGTVKYEICDLVMGELN